MFIKYAETLNVERIDLQELPDVFTHTEFVAQLCQALCQFDLVIHPQADELTPICKQEALSPYKEEAFDA